MLKDSFQIGSKQYENGTHATYHCFKTKDVGIKTQPVLRDEQSSMKQDVTTQSTRIICSKNKEFIKLISRLA